MKRIVQRTKRRERRKRGLRRRIIGTPQRPRMAVFRSLRHIYVQVVDDLSGTTLAAASSAGDEAGGRCEGAVNVGRKIAERATQAGIKRIVFDRGGFKFHGRVKALAEAVREGGLEF